MCEREREIKEREAFVFAAAQRLIQGESPGKNFSLATVALLADRTT